MKAPVKKASVKKKTATKKTAAPLSDSRLRTGLVDVLISIAIDSSLPAGPRVEAAGLLLEAADRSRQLELLELLEASGRDLERRLKVLEARRTARTA